MTEAYHPRVDLKDLTERCAGDDPRIAPIPSVWLAMLAQRIRALQTDVGDRMDAGIWDTTRKGRERVSVMPEGAQLSEDGNYWWDGSQWQAVAQGGSSGGSSTGKAAAAPPEVVLVGVAGFDPPFPVVGHEIVYTWSEENIGGPATDAYHARVEFKDPDGNIIDSELVECSALDTKVGATRSQTLSAPTKATIGYSIELWVDVDHNTNFSEGLNYAYHNVDVSDT